MARFSFLRVMPFPGVMPFLRVMFTETINIFLSARIPSEISTFIVSGILVPLSKKGGGARPVVVGEGFRRLLSKLCVANVDNSALAYRQPLQLGVG